MLVISVHNLRSTCLNDTKSIGVLSLNYDIPFQTRFSQTPQPSKLPLSPKEFEILFLEEASGDRQTHAHTTLDLLLEVRKHLGNSTLEGAGKCLPEFKNSSKTLEWEMLTLALADPITGPTAGDQGVLGLWADQSLSGDLLILLLGFYMNPSGPRQEVCSTEERVLAGGRGGQFRIWGNKREHIQHDRVQEPNSQILWLRSLW